MKFNPKTHIIGKVYDLTQENMCAMLEYIDELKDKRIKLKEKLERTKGHMIRKRIENDEVEQLVFNGILEENERLKELVKSNEEEFKCCDGEEMC